MQWRVGDKVRHISIPDWTFGEVLAVGQAGTVTVRFEAGGVRTTKADRLARLTDDEIAARLPKRRGPARRTTRDAKPFSAYREAFIDMFPRGFCDPSFIDRERDYKIAAGTFLHEQLGTKPFSTLMKIGDFAEVSRRARRVVGRTNLVFPNEGMGLKDGLDTPGNQECFAIALHSLLHGTGDFQGRMGRFMSVLADIGAAKWTIATYFPFLAYPKHHFFIKPIATKRIAAACQIELNYQPDLNWLTYACALELASTLKTQLADLKPRDMIDVQSFIWVVARD